ncbi:MAG: TOBE domain-containing protein [Deltaproteobacteria bacterium]|jgi:molybdate transport system regulatory protein|nr:TOBE domain-containing protein [Deltaproteobacteria bacterium]
MRNKINSLIEQADESTLALMLSLAEKKLLRLGGRPDSLAPVWRDEIFPDEKGRCLDAEELKRIAGVFDSWFAGASSAVQKRSRGRVRLIFLLIRYGGLRLGEALALDDRSIDPGKAVLTVRGQYARTVQMPAEAMRLIGGLLEDPMFYSLRGELTRIDPGYLRRKFYNLAARAGLPGALLNPRILRHSRALELLRGGVPLQAVQYFLGKPVREQSSGIKAGLGDFSAGTAQRIVAQYLERETRMKSSARNVFVGRITKITKDNLLAEVELATLSDLKVVAIITGESLQSLGLETGRTVTATIKAPWVILAEAEKGLRASARNKFTGRVSAVKSSEIAAEVLVDLYEGSKVCALVTSESARNLDLAPGREITAMFKAFAVVLTADI